MKNVKLISAATIALLISGCTLAPTIKYTKINSPKDIHGEEIDTFVLRESTITIDKSGTKKDASENTIDNLVITSSPAESTNAKFSMTHADPFYAKSNINMTKIQNTEIPNEISYEVKDGRIEALKVAGAIATLVAKTAYNSSTGVTSTQLPKTINTSVHLENQKIGVEAGTIVLADGIEIEVGPLPTDAQPIKNLDTPLTYSGIFYAACRKATIRFKYNTNTKYEKSFKISDPRYYQLVAFPAKGKISFHSECGVSVLSEKDTGQSSTLSIIEASIAQINAVKEAIDAAKKENK
ncbi:hypothetical protein [Pseudomonas anguilliseptica]|uniref:hypothetical protein n=1 Tax=Pseudomonas anguilliseptica TaxID=53406 RepID=UPI0022AFD976|nr:hypothetical protein [Pseudomonas anguilliseptica]MCZ4324497.1 hypothetical protein [Pseudomonas anguilliseptica]